MGVYPDESDFGTTAIEAPCSDMTCQRCGHGGMRADTISTAFWKDGGIIVIRDIPALVCAGCREEYIDDATALALDRMRGAGFRAEAAVERVEVPVFRFVGGPETRR